MKMLFYFHRILKTSRLCISGFAESLISTAVMIFISSQRKYLVRICITSLIVCSRQKAWKTSTTRETREKIHAQGISSRVGSLSDQMNTSIKSISEFFHKQKSAEGTNFSRESNLSFKGMVQFWLHSLYLSEKVRNFFCSYFVL